MGIEMLEPNTHGQGYIVLSVLGCLAFPSVSKYSIQAPSLSREPFLSVGSSSSRDLTPSSDLLSTRHTCGAHTYVNANTQIDKINRQN